MKINQLMDLIVSCNNRTLLN